MSTLLSPKKTNISKEQQIQLVQLIKQLLSLGKHPSGIKQAVIREYDLASRSVERYITRARREMNKYLEVPIEQLRADSFVFYLSIINDSKILPRDRIRARERIDKLLGLEQPVHSHNHIHNSDLNYTTQEIRNMSDEELEALYQKIETEPDNRSLIKHKQVS